MIVSDLDYCRRVVVVIFESRRVKRGVTAPRKRNATGGLRLDGKNVTKDDEVRNL